MTMKKNQNGNSFDSITFGEETDSLAYGSKARYEFNDSRMDSNHAKLEEKDTDDPSKFKVTDDSSMNDEKITIGSPKKAGQNVLSHHLSADNENGVGSPRKKSEDELSHQLSIWGKDTDSLSSDSSDIDKEEHRSPEHETFDTAEEFSDCNKNYSRDSSSPLFTEKNALECNLPDLEVCYEEIDYQILKDLCIDVARHQKNVNSIESCTDYISHLEVEEDSSLDSDSSSTADQCKSKEENDGGTLVSQERLDSCLVNSLEMETVEHRVPDNAAATSESSFDAARKAETDSFVDDSIVDGKLQIEGSKVLEVPDQSLNPSESLAAPSAEAGGTGNDVQVNWPLYNSNIETGNIAFNFSYPEGVLIGNVAADDIEEQFAAGDVNDENLPDSKESKAECRSNTDQCVTGEGEGSSSENGHEGSPAHRQSNSNDIPTDEPAESTSGNLPTVSHLQQDMGETSFSVVSYSGPIAFSGSLSHRSDSSTTSGKSFAFPILQSEWNSSPVRMAKADRKHFRKHKGWRSGVLCCRF